jgi:Tol biopolymer transport system component
MASENRANLYRIGFDLQTGKTRGPLEPITRGTSVSAHPDVSPDGEWLVFDSWGGYEQEDLFVIHVDGQGRRRLTSDAYMARMPRWSPDGSRIAFVSNRTGLGQIWVVNEDGSGHRLLTESPNSIAVDPAWSPKGHELAYSSSGEEGSRTCILDVSKPWSEQNPRTLPEPVWEGETFSVDSWSPDGNWLAGTITRAEGYNVGVAVYSFDTEQYVRLFDIGRRTSRCRWLDDSRRLLFGSEDGLYILDRVTKEYEEASDSVGSYFALSPDNRTLYFSRSQNEADIWVLTLIEEP